MPNLALSRHRNGAADTEPERAKPPDDELASLLGAVRQGCRSSFARLYVLTSPHLFAAVLRINHDRAAAEDVLQEIYIKVWSRSAQFDARRGLAIYWLVGIARHGALDSLRRSSTRPQSGFASLDADDDPYAELPSPWLTPLELVMRARAADAVQRCLRALSDEQRECLTLSFYDDLSHDEIARRIGRPVGTVKSWLRRSVAAMRAALAGHG